MSALKLPRWEWQELINQYYGFLAENRIHALMTSGLGFSGGEGAEQYINNQQKIISSVEIQQITKKKNWKTAKGKDFRNLQDWGDAESLDQLDKFLNVFGI